jgi:hypothetical protein
MLVLMGPGALMFGDDIAIRELSACNAETFESLLLEAPIG